METNSLYATLTGVPDVETPDPLDLGIEGIEDPDYQDPDQPSYTDDTIIEQTTDPEAFERDDQEDSVVNKILEQKGIDPNAIKIEDENGEEIVVPFNELSADEQSSILEELYSTTAEDELNDDEIEVVNFLRENDFKLEDAIEHWKRQGIEDFIREQEALAFDVDKFTDEELYVIDLKSKFEDLTDEELELELTKQLENQELFKKKVDKIRQEYKEAHEQDLEFAATQKAQEEQALIEELQSNLIRVATSTEDIGGIVLDDDDKENVLSLILDRDANNASKLLKHLDDPETLFKVSWFVQYGEEAFSAIHDYWKSEIEKITKSNPSKSIKGSSTRRTSVIPDVTTTNVFAKKEDEKVITMDDIWNKVK